MVIGVPVYKRRLTQRRSRGRAPTQPITSRSAVLAEERRHSIVALRFLRFHRRCGCDQFVVRGRSQRTVTPVYTRLVNDIFW